jgi:hypothetical protein
MPNDPTYDAEAERALVDAITTAIASATVVERNRFCLRVNETVNALSTCLAATLASYRDLDEAGMRATVARLAERIYRDALAARDAGARDDA